MLITLATSGDKLPNPRRADSGGIVAWPGLGMYLLNVSEWAASVAGSRWFWAVGDPAQQAEDTVTCFLAAQDRGQQDQGESQRNDDVGAARAAPSGGYR